MKLIDLNPTFVNAGGPGITRNGKPVPERIGVGLACDCPCGCDIRLFVYFKNPLDKQPFNVSAAQWERKGKTFKTLTLTPSIKRISSGCKWHGYLTNGEFKACD